MASLQSAAPIPAAAQKGYDPEIKDMADYIHNYNVDSDLAVWGSACSYERTG
jgi:2-methylcitrate dehydratase